MDKITATFLAPIVSSFRSSLKSVSSESKAAEANPEQWLDEYGDWLYQYALARVRDSHAAEDLVQEALVSGFRGFKNFEGRSTVKTWLTSILRNRIADYFKKKGRQPSGLSNDESDSMQNDLDHFAFSVKHAKLFHPKVSNQEFASSMERAEFWDALKSCLEKLPVHLQQAFLHRMHHDEQSIEEISQSLAVTKNNLSVRLFRSRLLLRECLERTWVNQ